ncbi:MAG: cation transporter [Hyphomonas sp.]|nr:cation transporter [Hyphomonas sp.]
MANCCESQSFDGVSSAYRRALVAVIAINGVMFFVEMAAGVMSGSQALKADALDFAGDTATYGLSLLVIGSSLRTRAVASLVKGGSLAVIALAVLAMTVLRILNGAAPDAGAMGAVGVLALVANLASVLILLKWRDGDSNVRSVWLCSRNDAIGNLGVIGAGGLVALTGTAWPDLIVAVLLAGLFLKSASAITIQALDEIRTADSSNSVAGVGS